MLVTLFGKTYEVTASTLKGRRESNQDAYGWVAVSSGSMFGKSSNDEIRSRGDVRPDFLMAVVCDGMGGLEDGAEASKAVVDGLVSWASVSTELVSEDGIWALLRRLAELEKDIMRNHPGSGTTLSLVLAVDRRWISVHLGDSRCYAVAENMRWRTKDHSPAENMYQNGLISEDEMKHGPMGSMVSAFIGGDHATELETEEIPKGWDRLVLCSDGAYGFMDSKTFYNLSVSSKDADEVVKIAYDFGSSDNITALVIRYVEMKEMMHLVKGAIFPSRRRR